MSTFNPPLFYSFDNLYKTLAKDLLREGDIVDVGEWQAIRESSLPQTKTLELEQVSFRTPIPTLMKDAQHDYMPNLPWAEDHFQERVSGIPLNPPPSHAWWPFAQNKNAQHMEEAFSHSYPERMWAPALDGIRFPYGNLDDVFHLLKTRPKTRQAYLTIWFPEDARAAAEGERVPCTLGYHFLIRGNKLNITYHIRSCDFFRHFRDDVYMAARLAQWMIGELNNPYLSAGNLTMHIGSMHVFYGEEFRLEEAAK